MPLRHEPNGGLQEREQGRVSLVAIFARDAHKPERTS